MSRIVLIHWNAAEAEERAAGLRRAGHKVSCYADQGGVGLRAFQENPPAAFVIDLGRLPSHGRAVATFLRQQKATRFVPLVFVAGEPEKVARTRELLPDAVFTHWNRVRGALRQALRKPPANPVVPGTMAGYSGTPLPKKLGIRPGSAVALLGAPAGFRRTLGALPKNVRLEQQARGRAHLILLFARSRADLKRHFPAAVRTMAERGGLWIVWPKKASGVATDLTQSAVRTFGLRAGLVDYKICALDQTWSGLCFARRRPRGNSGRS